MKKPISLIVTDSGPLITLALAGKLDALTIQKEIEVVIPDLIRFEVLRHLDNAAWEINSWIRHNEPEKVRVVPTEEYEEFMLLLRLKPNAKIKNRGEAAASEVLKRELARGDRIGILLFEDVDFRANRYALTTPDNVLMLATAQFLMGWER